MHRFAHRNDVRHVNSQHRAGRGVVLFIRVRLFVLVHALGRYLQRVNPLPRKHLILIGLRGSGKSTLGRALSVSIGATFTDLDRSTALRMGTATAGEAFRKFGERAFRDAESEALREALVESALEIPRVLALGGGTPTAPGAAEHLTRAHREGRAFVVFLDPPLEVLAARLRAETGDRPSLTGRGVVEEIEEIAAVRRPIYAALADLVVGRDACDGADAVSEAASIERAVREVSLVWGISSQGLAGSGLARAARC